MQDRVDALAELGVRATFLNSTLSAAEAAAVECRVRNGELDLVYVSPARLLQQRPAGVDTSNLSQWAPDRGSRRIRVE